MIRRVDADPAEQRHRRHARLAPARSRRRRRETGQAAVEYLGVIGYVIIGALAAWQLLLVAATLTSVENAARVGSRAVTLGQPGEAAALQALSSWLRDDAVAEVGPNPGCDDDPSPAGTRTVVCVQVPIFLPGLSSDALQVRRDAELPPP